MKMRDKVRILIHIDKICDEGQTGVIIDYPCHGYTNCAFVQFDDPHYGENGYEFADDEIEVLN